MTPLAVTAALTAIFAFVADRVNALKSRPVLLGLWFGIPAFAASVLPATSPVWERRSACGMCRR